MFYLVDPDFSQWWLW